jgi:hypothetical protein
MRDADGSQLDVSLLQDWVGGCESFHRHHRNEDMALIGLILIDIKERRLVEASSSSRYLTLSYVWGDITQYKITTAALNTLKRKDSLRLVEDEIPQIIKDAIEFVDFFVERYLWVDVLCITHDDEEQKHHQIAQMASIYQQAVLTIMALSGKDASSGLPGFRLHSRLAE